MLNGPAIRIPGAPNALAARLIEAHGFEAIYLSGAALSAGVLGLPDVGLFTLTELAEQTRYLTRSVTIPVIVDADTGFGGTANVQRTVEELEAAGAAAIQLEDQCLPKRCGHLSGKQLVDEQTMCAKIRAATAARADEGTIILARTDARGVDGFDSAVQRTHAYLSAGADWIFPEALESADELARFASLVTAPLVANMTEFGKSPLLTHSELSEMGYAAVIYPVTLLRVAMKAMESVLAVLDLDGTQRDVLDLMQTREELYDLLEYEDFDQRDRQFFRGRNDG
jgi:methylisocitrate lyase